MALIRPQIGMQKRAAVPALLTPTMGAGVPALKRARVDPNTRRGEVRFSSAESVQHALSLSGTMLDGFPITIEMDERSKDGTKVIVSGLPQTMAWNRLKDHFASCGQVLYADVKTATPTTGEVRFDSAGDSQAVLETLNGTDISGYPVAIKPHPGSKDGTKLMLFNLPPGLEWQDLKDFFKQYGYSPAYVATSAGGGVVTAEVRYDDAMHAQLAIQMLNGQALGGATITVEVMPGSADGTKLKISGVPPGLQWQELKDHFGQVGKVAFVQVHGDEKGGKGGSMVGGKLGGMLGLPKGGQGGQGMMQQMQQMQQMMQTMQQMMGMQGGAKLGKGAQGAFYAGGAGAVGGAGRVGEVRYDFPMHAQAAAMTLNGSQMLGQMIQCGLDPASNDGSKLWVSGVPAGATWQQLKDHFAQCGQVAFANLK